MIGLPWRRVARFVIAWVPRDGLKEPEGRVDPVVQLSMGTVGEIRLAAGVISWVVGGPRSEPDRCCNTSIFSTPMSAKLLPFLTNLVFTGLRLDSNISVCVKPGGPEASEHVREDSFTRGIKEFRDGCNMEIQAAVIDDDYVSLREVPAVDHIVHDVLVVLAFAWYGESVVEAERSVDGKKERSQGFDPPAFEMR